MNHLRLTTKSLDWLAHKVREPDLIWAYVRSLGYCAQWRIEAFPEAVIRLFAPGKRSSRFAQRMVDAELWAAADEECEWYRPVPFAGVVIEWERPPLRVGLRERVLMRDGNACVACGSHEDLHIDHRMPVSRGGRSTESNLQTLCRSCNLSKGAQHPDEWIARQG